MGGWGKHTRRGATSRRPLYPCQTVFHRRCPRALPNPSPPTPAPTTPHRGPPQVPFGGRPGAALRLSGWDGGTDRTGSRHSGPSSLPRPLTEPARLPGSHLPPSSKKQRSCRRKSGTVSPVPRASLETRPPPQGPRPRLPPQDVPDDPSPYRGRVCLSVCAEGGRALGPHPRPW